MSILKSRSSAPKVSITLFVVLMRSVIVVVHRKSAAFPSPALYAVITLELLRTPSWYISASAAASARLKVSTHRCSTALGRESVDAMALLFHAVLPEVWGFV